MWNQLDFNSIESLAITKTLIEIIMLSMDSGDSVLTVLVSQKYRVICFA